MKRGSKVVLVLFFLLMVGTPFAVGEFIRHTGCPAVSYVPQVNFDAEWDAEDETLVVRHGGGDALSPDDNQGTVKLFVTITDAETGAEQRVTWFKPGGYLRKSIGNPPVEDGDALTINQSATGFVLSPGDTVRVWWRGDIGYPQPFWCFDQGVGNHLLAKQNISSNATGHSGGRKSLR